MLSRLCLGLVLPGVREEAQARRGESGSAAAATAATAAGLGQNSGYLGPQKELGRDTGIYTAVRCIYFSPYSHITRASNQ